MKLSLLLVTLAFITACSSASTINSYNASTVTIVSGSNIAGSLGNTNLSDGVTYDLNESNSSSHFATVCVVDQGNQATHFCQVFNYTDSTWTNKTSSSAGSGTTAAWTWMQANPWYQETHLGQTDSTGINGQNFNGTSFTSTFNFNGTQPSNVPGYTFASEHLNGKMLVVYSGGANQIVYQIWNQSNWSNAVTLQNYSGVGTINWFTAASDPNSNNITVIMQNSSTSGGLWAMRFNGTDQSWSNATKIDDKVSSTNTVQDPEDVAYDNQSNALIAYTDATTKNVYTKVYYANGTISAPNTLIAAGANIRYVRLVNQPGTGMFMVCYKDDLQSFNCGQVNITTSNSGPYSPSGTIFWGISTTADNSTSQGRIIDEAPLASTGGFVFAWGDNAGNTVPSIAMCANATQCWTTGAISYFTSLFTSKDNLGMKYLALDPDPINQSQFIVAWKSNNTGGSTIKTNTSLARFFCTSSTCALLQDTSFIRNNTAGSSNFRSLDVKHDQWANYTGEVWFNSTPTSDVGVGNVTSLNATVLFNATYAGNYSLYIYNWSATAWAFCNSSVVTSGANTQLNCTNTADPNDFRNGTGNTVNNNIRISLNESIHTQAINASTAKIDYVSFNVTYTSTVNASPKIAEFRIYDSPLDNTIGAGTLICNVSSTYGNDISNNTKCSNNLLATKNYRYEIEVCNDAGVGASNLTAGFIINQLNFTKNINDITCGINPPPFSLCGYGYNGSIPTGLGKNACSVVTTGVQISTTNIPDIPSAGSRSSTNCDYFVYMPGKTCAASAFSTNQTNYSLTSLPAGVTNNGVSNLSINWTVSDTAFTLLLPSTGCTLSQGNSSGCTGGAGSCTCDRCWISTTNLTYHPIQNNVSCQGQTSSTSFFSLLNQGTGTEQWQVLLNQSLPSTLKLLINTSANAGGMDVNASTQAMVNSSISEGAYAYAWMYGSFNLTATGNTTVNVQSNTSTS